MGQAAVIEVRPGDQMSAIDLRVNRRRSYRIRGRVIDEGSGRFPATASISVTVLSPTGLGNTLFSDPTQTYDSASGIFEIRNIAPGSYLVGAALPERSSDSSEGPAMLESAVLVAVTVTDSDVDNVVLAVRPPTPMPGRLRIDGSQPLATVPGIAQMRVELEASINGGVIPNAPTPDAEFRWVSADGAFILSRVAQGEYRVRVTELPPDYYIKDVRFNQTDTLNAPMHFSGDVSAPLEVLLSPNGGRIDGTVINEKQNLMAGIEAVLIPDRRRDRTDLYKTATTDETGHFTIQGIPPGDYKIFAWEGIEEFGYYDSDLIRLFEQKGTPVRIVQSAKESLEVRIMVSFKAGTILDSSLCLIAEKPNPMSNQLFHIRGRQTRIRNSLSLIRESRLLMRNCPFVIRASQTQMRNELFLIGERPLLMRNCLFLIRGKQTRMRDWPFLIRGRPAQMRN